MLDLKQASRGNTQVSIIIPTYNESLNILKILKSIGDSLPKNIISEAIVVDDNSPDGTGKIVEDYLKNLKKATAYSIDVIHRKTKMGLSSAILNGIQRAKGDTSVANLTALAHRRQSQDVQVTKLQGLCETETGQWPVYTMAKLVQTLCWPELLIHCSQISKRHRY